ncbi:drebrin-like protein B isoform X3 [Macrobrachium rosenbergii]|uniref:drebrin-like protein B isoform X3 n=2 Tax=Macrobrachium rosenbergii TaxID=79674 RepID=UPI0034D69C51
MSIDLDKNRNALLAAFNDVLNDKTKTDWALFGYEGQSNVLKVVGTGEDGIEELAEDLNSSKIMYAVVKVTDPNTTRPKVVLINWQGEGAPTLRKGTCARHLNDVNKFFRGVHVTVNARTEEEVETDVIMAAVLKASATTYNFNERSEINDKTTPVKGLVDTFKRGEASGAVGTNYKRTNPLAEIDTKSRNQFWEEQEAEERRRKTEEQQKRDEELKRLEVERKQREINDAKHREILTKERNARILAERKAEEEAAKRLAAQDDKKWQEDLQSQYQEEQERAKRAEMMRLERKKEAESLIGHRTHSTRAMFETGNTTSEKNTELNRPPPRKLKEFKPTNTSERVENNDTPSVIPSKGVTARWPPANTTAQREDTSPNQNRDKVSPLSSVENRTRNQVSSTTVPSIIKQHPVEPMPQPPPQFQAPLPEVQPQHPSQPQSIQEPALHPQSNGDVRSNTYNDAAVTNKANQGHFENDHSYDAMANAPSKASEVSDSAVQNNVVDADPAINNTTPSIGMVYEVDGMEYQILPEHGLCARALYDYQAADDTEITFDPEEIITNIDQIDAGWWQGVGPDGSFGLFPANYVELINHSGV